MANIFDYLKDVAHDSYYDLPLNELDTYVGSRKSGSSSITLTVFTGNEKRTVNIANSSQTLARTLKSELKTPTMIDVEVNKEGQIIFVH